MKKYIFMSTFLLVSAYGFSQEMSNSKKQPVVSAESKKETNVTTEETKETYTMGQGKNASPQKVEQPAKKEENTPAAVESTNKKVPK